MKIDVKKLQEEIDGGWVNAQNHPNLPLKILKYSKASVYSSRWNDITLLCRGLVIDENGSIVIHSMKKFFNHNQLEGGNVLEQNKNTPYKLLNKMDGSLIQVAYYNDEIVISSSGSFTSNQAVRAKELLDSDFSHYKNYFEKGKTYIFEYIAPSNRIVLSYDFTSLTLLAIKDTETGMEFPLDNRFDCVKDSELTLEEALKDLNREDYINKEGFVILYENGDRLKLKYDKYCLLHKTISGISEKWVWECLLNGIDTNATLIDIPDELYNFIDKTKTSLKSSFDNLFKEVNEEYNQVKLISGRKEQASIVLSKYKNHSKFIFGLLDNKDISKIIWQAIEPENSSKFGVGEQN